jgi:phosphoribosylanthranilate isomerase
MIIKVCGMRDAENIREVEALGIDLMGFIFWPKSSRYVSERPTYLPTHCKRVGVFVDADIEQVKHTAFDYALDYIQLHGHETPDSIRALRVVDGFPVDIRLIKAISINGRDDIATYKPYEGLADYFLFDTKAQLPGGNGQQFDWSVLSAYDGNTPLLLSGGIGPDDAERLRTLRVLDGFPVEKCIGIDLNSRFEVSPALKDINKLKEFIKKVRI